MAPSRPAALPEGYARQISREDLALLPLARFEGEVWLIETREALARAMQDIRADSVVGFDTESRPSFRKGENHPPCLVQVATARGVHIFPLQRLECHAELGAMLADAAIIKTGVGLADDLRQLKRVFDSKDAALVDCGAVARRHGLKQTGLRNLAAIFLGIRVAKGKRTSNWAAPRLSAAQISYAATDAWVCRELLLCLRGLGLPDSAGHVPERAIRRIADPADAANRAEGED